jgi:hypothetical protein
MKLLYFILFGVIALSCTNPQEKKRSGQLASPESAINSAIEQLPDSSNWTAHFQALQKAIATGDRIALKAFIDFPIKDEGNDIWYIADSKLVMEINPKEIKPFTEVDYEEYFGAIFSLDFRKTFEKLNLEEFFRNNSATSPEIEFVKGTKSQLQASYDKAAQKLTLTVLSKGESFEFAVIYEFDISADQKIKLRQVHVAG